MIEILFEQDSYEVGSTFSGSIIWQPEKIKAFTRIHLTIGWRTERNEAWQPKGMSSPGAYVQKPGLAFDLSDSDGFSVGLSGINLSGIGLSIDWHRTGDKNIDQETLFKTKVKPNKQVPLTFKIPESGPVSYDGRLFKVLWEVSAKLDYFGCEKVNIAKSFNVVPRKELGPAKAFAKKPSVSLEATSE